MMKCNTGLLLAVALVFGLAKPGQAQSSETWECNVPFNFGQEADVILTADHEALTGTITAHGLPEISTFSKIEGFSRLWVWQDDDGQVFGFLIRADRSGGYYKISDDGTEVLPEMHYPICKIVE